jgi:hypothetical protein
MAVLFNKEMTDYLVENITQSYQTFFPLSKEAHFARKSQDAWKNLTEEMNSQYGTNLTEKQIRDKWHNKKKRTKSEFSEERKLVYFS